MPEKGIQVLFLLFIEFKQESLPHSFLNP